MVKTNRELCEHFNVAIYQIGDLDGMGEEGDCDKYFVSTLVGEFEDDEGVPLVGGIPLSDTFDEAEALAVEHLDLGELFDKGEPAPRWRAQRMKA